MDIMLKGNNGEKVVIPIEDLIQKYWSDENSKPNRIEMSATVKDETILAAMTICDEKDENLQWYWLMNKVRESATGFSSVYDDGYASASCASYSFGVRPAFKLKNH